MLAKFRNEGLFDIVVEDEQMKSVFIREEIE